MWSVFKFVKNSCFALKVWAVLQYIVNYKTWIPISNILLLTLNMAPCVSYVQNAVNHLKSLICSGKMCLFYISAERRRAMCVVSVPLDIDDTLRCFRESQAKRQHTLRTFQHSHTLLMLLLANTQHCESLSLSCTQSDLELGLEPTGHQ